MPILNTLVKFYSKIIFFKNRTRIFSFFLKNRTRIFSPNSEFLHISDKTSSIPLIVIAVMACLGLFLIPSVLFLVWKVRKQNKQLSYLTQEEVDEFLLGRPDYIPFQCDMSTYAYY